MITPLIYHQEDSNNSLSSLSVKDGGCSFLTCIRVCASSMEFTNNQNLRRYHNEGSRCIVFSGFATVLKLVQAISVASTKACTSQVFQERDGSSRL
ncbi:hypothetical protein Q3G72_012434 [Acer saccharum]|nr:hypothetical protein Q3G72_012434 [Acer saccharum]